MDRQAVSFATIAREVYEELERATSKHGPYPSSFHGYAVILEELDELWDEIKSKEATREEVKKEAIQIASAAIRFIMDLM